MTEQPGVAKSEFASLVHGILMSGKGLSMQDVASMLGMDYHRFYGRLRGRARFSVEEVRQLLRIVPDATLAEYVLAESPFFAADRVADRGDRRETLKSGAARAVYEAADILRAVEMALADGKIDHIEKPEIVRQVDEAARAIAGLKQLLQ